MIEKGDVVSVEIVDMTNDGDGVGKINDRVIFVKGAILGETVSATVTKVKKNFLNGKAREVLSPSPYALPIDEVCPHIAEGCGGCNLGRLNYGAQLKLKSNRLKSALERIGGFNLSGSALDSASPEGDESTEGDESAEGDESTEGDENTEGDEFESIMFEEIIPSPKVKAYRNKAVFSVSGTRLGFLKSKSRDVVDCPHCQIQMPEIMAAADGIRRFLRDFPKDSRLINSVMIRVGDDGKVMVVISGEPDDIKHLQEFVDYIYEEAELVSLYGKTSSKKSDPVLLAGVPTLVKSIDDMKFETSPEAFFQVNEEQVSRLYAKARAYAKHDDVHQKNIADLYCGVGTIGLSMAGEDRYIVGVESNKEATLNANRNAVINGIVNARFFNGAVENVLPQLITEGIKGYRISHFDVVVVDPPRAGCDERLLSTIGKVRPGAIVYVSCDPATLSRDLGILCNEHGYRLEKICPVDMFPGSMHVETVALLSKLKSTNYITVDLNTDELDLTSAESSATYMQVKEYILEKYKTKVSTLNISQIKKKYGITTRKNYNLSKKENHKVPNCTPEKEEMIVDAFKHFQMI